MSSESSQLDLWSTRNRLRDFDAMQRDFAPMSWSNGTDEFPHAPELGQVSEVHGANAVTDDWAQLLHEGFLQGEDGLLRLRPILVYPGLVLTPWLEQGTPTPPSSALWVVVHHVLEPVYYPWTKKTGWSGRIVDARAWVEWGGRDPRPNQIFPGTKDTAMPPNNTLIWHFRHGFTDAQGRYSRKLADEPGTLGQYCPPY